MAIRPALRTAVAGNKIKASEYNDNFTDMLNYLDDVVDDMEDYVDGYMPTQSGQDGKFLSTNGTAASWTDIMPTLAGLPSSDIINGLVITKNTSSPNDTIDVSAGSCFDSTKAKILNLGSAKTKQNSSQAISTTYYVYLIAKSDLSAYDVLITTSSSSPMLPTDYVYYRQIGSYATDGSGYISSISNFSNNASTNFIPDYTNGISKTSGTEYTATQDGLVVVSTANGGNPIYCYIIVNGITVVGGKNDAGLGTFNKWITASVTVKKGDTYTGYVNNASGNVKFYPIG